MEMQVCDTLPYRLKELRARVIRERIQVAQRALEAQGLPRKVCWCAAPLVMPSAASLLWFWC